MNFEEFVQAFISANYNQKNVNHIINSKGNNKNNKNNKFPINSVPLGKKRLIYL